MSLVPLTVSLGWFSSPALAQSTNGGIPSNGTYTGGSSTTGGGTVGGTGGVLNDPTHGGGATTGSPGGGVLDPGENPVFIGYDDVAAIHSPIHYQFTNDHKVIGDYLAPFDYDDNLFANDNWDHLQANEQDLVGTVYYSVTETCTHWFVVYAMFHPQDWANNYGQEHENDFEGLVAAIRKDDTGGQLEAVITEAHWNFYSYVPQTSSWESGAAKVDGTLYTEDLYGVPHMTTVQEAEGHGLYAYSPLYDLLSGDGALTVAYRPSVHGSVPSGAGTNADYELVSLFDTLWPLELDAASYSYVDDPVYHQWGTLNGNCSGTAGDGLQYLCKENSAQLPWAWNDVGEDITGQHIGADGLAAGLMALDPATLFADYFDNTGDFSMEYVSNQYVEDLRTRGWTNSELPTWGGAFPENLFGDRFPIGDIEELYGRLDTVCR